MDGWGDDNSTLFVTTPGEERYSIPAGSAGVMISNPKDRKILGLESKLEQFKAQLG